MYHALSCGALEIAGCGRRGLTGPRPEIYPLRKIVEKKTTARPGRAVVNLDASWILRVRLRAGLPPPSG